MSHNIKMLAEDAADQILKLITNKYQEGDKLPNETELAEWLKVSRPTIREAIKYLRAINVLEIKRGKGTFVCINPGMVEDPLGCRFVDKNKLVVDLYEMRLILEPEIAALATEKATPECVEKMRVCAQNFVDGLGKYKAGEIKMIQVLQNDIEFHKAVADCCDNTIVERIMPIINKGLMDLYYGNESHRYASGRNHFEIIDAIVEKDPSKARDIMRRHIIKGRENMPDDL